MNNLMFAFYSQAADLRSGGKGTQEITGIDGEKYKVTLLHDRVTAVDGQLQPDMGRPLSHKDLKYVGYFDGHVMHPTVVAQQRRAGPG